MSEKTLISVRALCKDFMRPGGSVLTALEGVNLDVFDGEFLAIVGLSGSGKSTLLRCMAGLMKPDRGQVVYSAVSEGDRPFSSFVFQNFALFPWLTVRENVEIAIQYLPRAEREQKTDAILATVGLAGFEDSYPRELSGGMRQRVSIARATVCDPFVMFMDEPFSSLDPLTSESMRAEMGRMWLQPNRRIRSIVLVTHSLDEALQLADRVVILTSSPGTIRRMLAVPLPRPRNFNAPEYLALEQELERAFGELHLDKLTAAHYDAPAADALSAAPASRAPGDEPPTAVQLLSIPPVPAAVGEAHGHHTLESSAARLKPLINLSPTVVEGLLSYLADEEKIEGPLDLYDVANEMKLRLDQMLPAVAAAEMLGFIDTPGTTLVLTPQGRNYATEQDSHRRQEMLRETVSHLPIVRRVLEELRSKGSDGMERSLAVAQLALFLPFEDPEDQFAALVRWGRAVNLLNYDAQTEHLAIVD